MSEPEAQVLQLRRRDRRDERKRTEHMIQRKAMSMSAADCIHGIRVLYEEYNRAKTSYLPKIQARDFHSVATRVARTEYDRTHFRLQFALGVEIHGPRIHAARAAGWMTNDIRVLRAAGVVG